MILSDGYSNPKEKLVIELRKEGKSYRQLAEEARISPRDIKLILDK
jgi:lambda repressor-like predicted transcriptional regulator